MKPAKMMKDLIAIADASRREDGADIPLGKTLRNAAAMIEHIDAERECYEMMAHDLSGRCGCRAHHEKMAADREGLGGLSMTARTCTVRQHDRRLRDPMDTLPHRELSAWKAERDFARLSEELAADLASALAANDGIGGVDPRNMGM